MPTDEEILAMIEELKREGYHPKPDIVLLCIWLEELKTLKEIKCYLAAIEEAIINK